MINVLRHLVQILTFINLYQTLPGCLHQFWLCVDRHIVHIGTLQKMSFCLTFLSDCDSILNIYRYLFDETEETPGDIWILASLLCTFLSNTGAGYKADRFLDGSHHLLGCNRMKEKSCEYTQDFTHRPFALALWGKMLNKAF